jgi:hypothetical protein
MFMNPVISQVREWQNSLCSEVVSFSHKHENLARLASIPVSVLDVALDTVALPLKAIQELAIAIINLLGAAFATRYTIRNALFGLQYGLGSAALFSVSVAMAPLKIFYQLVSIAAAPGSAKSIHKKEVDFSSYLSR